MIDVHAHVLHNIDDGPEFVEKSIALVKKSYEQGIEKIVSTSHYYSSRVSIDEFLNRREQRIRELQNELAVRQIGVELLSGAEVSLTPVLLNLEDLSKLCFEGTNYILLEIPHEENDFDRVYDLVERVSSYFNVRPIIAHIERYRYLYANRENLKKFREIGCLFQIDADIVLRGMFFAKRTVMNLISDGFVDIVASDCHDEIRCPNLEPAYEVIEKKLGKDVCYRLKKNPYLILENVSAQKIMP